MNVHNKKNLKWGWDILSLVLLALLAVAVCAGVWNYCPETWVNILAGVLLAAVFFAIFRAGRRILISD